MSLPACYDTFGAKNLCQDVKAFVWGWIRFLKVADAFTHDNSVQGHLVKHVKRVLPILLFQSVGWHG